MSSAAAPGNEVLRFIRTQSVDLPIVSSYAMQLDCAAGGFDMQSRNLQRRGTIEPRKCLWAFMKSISPRIRCYTVELDRPSALVSWKHSTIAIMNGFRAHAAT